MKDGYREYSGAEHAHASSSDAAQKKDVEPSGTVVTLSSEPFLAADVGGTHARIGLLSFRPNQAAPVVLAYRVYKCAEYTSLDAIVRSFCHEHAVRPQRLALACAGFLHEGKVVNNNLQWPVVPAALEKQLGLSDVEVLNDFEALAYGTAYLDVGDVRPLHRPLQNEKMITGPVVIVGPGTGLGVAVRLPGAKPNVLATEAGHIQLAARVGREQQVLAELTQADTHVPYDYVLSGPGLLRLYGALCRLERQPTVFHDPAAITAAACAGTNACAVETLQLFCGWLGSFLGDLAMLYGATGGIYLAGGFLSQMIEFVEKSTFVSRFLDKGVMRPFQQTVPVYVVDHAQLAVIGAASWLMNGHAQDKAA
ncbi:glucokinase [Dyella lipolytica]|uniref:glucokinase n=1 Tax=Dyella lipolytica TaxID=1867835 RepID=UPI00235C78FD|nr:glucokinase [Dyella lipolytica]GLQ45873.1 glucokinase [Dyella lipolytica]